ncbi:MAG: ABC transporter permease [Paludibacter sp.]|nr:ABC transporter permease [Paludibacter sp.]
MNTLQEIFAGLRHNKMRTVLTGLSVSWGIFILIVLLGAGNGLKNGVTSNFSDRATNTVQIGTGTTTMPYQGLKSGRELKYSEKEVDNIKQEIEAADKTTAIIEKTSTVSYGSEHSNYQVIGCTPDYLTIFNLKFEKGNGRFINKPDLISKNKVAVIDIKIKEVLFKEVNPIGKYIKVGSIMFQIIGVNSKKAEWGDGNIYIPYTTAQLIYNPDRKFREIAMTVNGLETEAENEAFNTQLKKNMAQSLRFNPEDKRAMWIWNSQRDYIETMKIFGGITLFVGIIGIFTLIAGIVGVSNIMLVSVKERTREFGIRKAIGAQPSHILRSVIIEAILITTVFGYLGMMLGVGLTEMVNFFLEQSASNNPDGMSIFKNPTVSLSYVFISTTILIISGVIAGYMPARRAVRIKPIEAMREE